MASPWAYAAGSSASPALYSSYYIFIETLKTIKQIGQIKTFCLIFLPSLKFNVLEFQ